MAHIAQDNDGDAHYDKAIYTDKGFADDSHVISAYKNCRKNEDKIDDNFQWSRCRVMEEAGFGKVYSRNPLLRHVSLLRIGSVDVARIVRVAVLFTNMHTCQANSQTTTFFNCRAPKLAQYMHERHDPH